MIAGALVVFVAALQAAAGDGRPATLEVVFVPEAAAAPHGMRVTAAPTGAASDEDRPLLDWMPSNEGILQVRIAVREAIGYAIGR